MCASMLSQSEEERTLNLSANEHYYYKCAHTRHRYMTIHAHIHKTHQMKRAALVIQRHYRGMRTRQILARSQQSKVEWTRLCQMRSREPLGFRNATNKWWGDSLTFPQMLPFSVNKVIRYSVGAPPGAQCMSAEVQHG